MQDKLNHWSDLPGRQVDAVKWKPGNTCAWLQFEEGVLEVESTEPGMPLRLERTEPELGELDTLTLTELKVTKVVVPYIAAGQRDDAAVLIGFEDGQVIRITSQDASVPLRIS